MHQTDAKRGRRRSADAFGVAMNVRGRMPGLCGVLVHVGVRVTDLAVLVQVRMEVAAAPAQEQPNRQKRRDDADEEFGGAACDVRQLRPEQDDRHAKQEERRCVSEPPEETEHAGTPTAPAIVREDERRDSGQMVRVGRMAGAEEQRDHQPQ
jgi:hypothetical protein